LFIVDQEQKNIRRRLWCAAQRVGL